MIPVLTPLDGLSVVGTDELTDASVTLPKLDPAAYAASNTASTLVQRNADGRASISDPIGPENIANMRYVNERVNDLGEGLEDELLSSWTSLSLNSGWVASPYTSRFKAIGNMTAMHARLVRNGGGTFPAGGLIASMPGATDRQPVLPVVYAPAVLTDEENFLTVLSITSSGQLSVSQTVPVGYALVFSCIFANQRTSI